MIHLPDIILTENKYLIVFKKSLIFATADLNVILNETENWKKSLDMGNLLNST